MTPSPRDVTAPEAEFAAVFKAADPATALALLAARDCALRSGTLHKLCPADVTKDGHIRVVTKRRRVVQVTMSHRLAAVIAVATQHCATPETPFLSALGLPCTSARSSALNRRLRKLQNKVGASPWTWHDLRRTAARKLYKATGDLGMVQALLGHQSLTSTLWYLQSPIRTLTAEQVALAASEEP